jgi:uncharacterized protein YjbI with pentapeptide repeats
MVGWTNRGPAAETTQRTPPAKDDHGARQTETDGGTSAHRPDQWRPPRLWLCHRLLLPWGGPPAGPARRVHFARQGRARPRHLRGQNLRGANLIRADLHDADLTGAFLGGARLRQALLTNAWLAEAELQQADLSHAVLRHANLSNANLSNANLTGADLSGAYLRRADLVRANLRRATLRDARLFGADLRHAWLDEAHLAGANLTDVMFSGAILTRADLSGANLTDATLAGATLTQADLCRANLCNVYLREANLRGARYDDATRWPAGFDPEAHGAVRVRGPTPAIGTAPLLGKNGGSAGFETAWRRAQQARVLAWEAVARKLEALEAKEPGATEGLRGEARRRAWLARDESGYLQRAGEAAARAQKLARTPREVYRTTLTWVRIEHDAGRHGAELRQARRLLSLAPHDRNARLLMQRAMRCRRREPGAVDNSFERTRCREAR